MNVVATVLCLAVTFFHVHANSEFQLNGKVAIVTGGAKGIGRAIADNYLKNGAETVIIVDKNQSRGLETEQELKDTYGKNRVFFIYADVTTDLDCVSKIIIKKYGCVDILVNNAGIVNEFNPEVMVNTNALAPVLWSQRFFECMRKDTGGRGGTIMNVASNFAYTRVPFFFYYKATKSLVLGLTMGMGHQYNYITTGVRVFAICPGPTRTDITQQFQFVIPEQESVFNKLLNISAWQSPDDVGKAAALLYTTAKTGMGYTVEGGEPPVVAPDSVNMSVEFINNL